MASESAPKRRPWRPQHKVASASRAMARLPIHQKKPMLVIPDDLSSTGACAQESLWGEEATVDDDCERLIAHPAMPALETKQWEFLPHLSQYPCTNVFEGPRKVEGPHKLKFKSLFRTMQNKMRVQGVLPGFLRLPVEVRNQIYGYIFSEGLVIIKDNASWPYFKDSTFNDALAESRQPGISNLPKAVKLLRIVNTEISSATVGRLLKKTRGVVYSRVPGLRPLSREGVIWETSLSNLLLTCKAFNTEAAPILYGIHTFYFDDAQHLRGFLETGSRRNLACITKVHIHVRTYGIPTKVVDNVWEQEHIKCWTSIFAQIAKKMTNLHVLRVTLTMRAMTESLKRAFKPAKNNTDWKTRSGYMLMLQPLSKLKKLDDLRVTVKATDYKMQQDQDILSHLIWNAWRLADVDPVDHLKVRVVKIYQRIFDEMLHGLEKGMTDVARSKDADKSFAKVALAVHKFIALILDPVGHMIMLDYDELMALQNKK